MVKLMTCERNSQDSNRTSLAVSRSRYQRRSASENSNAISSESHQLSSNLTRKSGVEHDRFRKRDRQNRLHQNRCRRAGIAADRRAAPMPVRPTPMAGAQPLQVQRECFRPSLPVVVVSYFFVWLFLATSRFFRGHRRKFLMLCFVSRFVFRDQEREDRG